MQGIINRLKRKSKHMLFLLFLVTFSAKTEGGFFYRTHVDLFATYRQPPTLGVSPPFVGGWISLRDWDGEAMSLFADSTGKVYLTVRGYFFLLERIDGGGSGGVPYLWEEWADKPQPWPVL